MNLRSSRGFRVVGVLGLAALSLGPLGIVGCQRATGPDLGPEVARLQSELESMRLKLEEAQKQIPGAKPEPVTSTAAADKGVLAPLNRGVGPEAVAASSATPAPAAPAATVDKDAQIKALQAEVAALKKPEVQAYVDASATQARGVTSVTLSRYQQFVKSFPDSPLVADANRAVAELTVAAEREAKWRASQIDPRRPEREVLQRFTEGLATVEELAPILKSRTTADVIKLLGPANTSYRNGTEIGYVDRILDTTTGNKATLVVAFEADRVAVLRVNYQGREVRP